MRKYFGFIFSVGLIVALGLGGVGQAAVNSWSGQSEKHVCFSQAVTSQSVALVVTAATGIAHNVRAITITNSASGYVRLYSSNTLIGSNLIGAWSVLANTPLVLTEESLGVGVATTKGDALYVDAATGTVSLDLRVREDKSSPR